MNNSSRVFTPAAQQAQAERGSAKAYAARVAEGFPDTITPELAAFIAEQDTVFLATATGDGAPYIQHRGGPKGFIKVIDEKTLGFADYRAIGNTSRSRTCRKTTARFCFCSIPRANSASSYGAAPASSKTTRRWSSGCSTKVTKRGPNARSCSRSKRGT